MVIFGRFIAWLRREMRLRKLHREVEERQQVWLATRLTEKHPDELQRHKKSSLAVLEFMKAAETYEKERRHHEF